MNTWLLLLVFAGCSAPSTDTSRVDTSETDTSDTDTSETGEETDPPDTGDTGQEDRCDEPYEPLYGYVNLDYETAECNRRGLFDFEEQTVYMIFEPAARMLWSFREVEEPLYPGKGGSLMWWSDRGADLYPGETYLQALGYQDQPVPFWLRDCPGESSSSCTWFLARSGRVSILEGSLCDTSYLRAQVDQLVFQEAERDYSNASSTWVAGGEVWCVEQATIELPIQIM